MESWSPRGNKHNFFNLPTELKEMIFIYATIYLSNRYSIYNYRLDDYALPIMAVCRDWYNIITDIRERKGLSVTRATTLSIAVSNINMFEWALTQTPPPPCRNDLVCYVAARHGNLEVFKEAIRRGFRCTTRALFVLPYSGNLEFVYYLYNNMTACHYESEPVYDGDIQHLLLHSIKSGHLDITKWVFSLLNRNCLRMEEVVEAAKQGHVDILKWHYTMSPRLYAFTITDYAIKYNHIKIIEWLMEYSLEHNIQYCRGCDGNIGDIGYLLLCTYYDNIDTLSTLFDFNGKYNTYVDLDSLHILIRAAESENNTSGNLYAYLIEKKADILSQCES